MKARRNDKLAEWKMYMNLYHKMDQLIKVVVHDDRFSMDDLLKMHAAQDVFFAHAMSCDKIDAIRDNPAYRYTTPEPMSVPSAFYVLQPDTTTVEDDRLIPVITRLDEVLAND